MGEDHGQGDQLRLTDAQVQRVVARAIEFDSPSSARTTIAGIRDILREVGITPRAVDLAIDELGRDLSPAEAQSSDNSRDPTLENASGGLPRPPSHWLLDGTRPVDASGTSNEAGIAASLLRNALVFSATWVLFGIVSRIAGSLAFDRTAKSCSQIALLAVAALLAERVGARFTAAFFAVFVAARIVWTLQLPGASNNWALITASFLGFAAGALLYRRAVRSIRS